MRNLTVDELVKCYICKGMLLPHPLYEKSGTTYCPEHGDFLVQKMRGKRAKIFYRPFGQEVVSAVLLKVNIPRIIRPKIRSVPTRRHPPPPQGRSGHPGIIVRCDQTGTIYKSLKEASDDMHFNKNSLSLHINNKARHVKGYTFTVIDDILYPPPFIKKRRVNPGGGVPPVRLQCDQTGQIFETVREVAKFLRVGRKYISQHINHRKKRPLVRGLSFQVLKD